MRLRIFSRGAAWRLGVSFTLLGIASTWGWFDMVRMPGKSHSGALELLDVHGVALRDQLRADVDTLAGQIGERSVRRPKGLSVAAAHIEAALAAPGLSPSQTRSPPTSRHPTWGASSTPSAARTEASASSPC